MKCRLTFIPDGFRHLRIAREVICRPDLPLANEGDCFVGQVEAFDTGNPGFLNHLHIDREIHRVRPGDTIPLIMAYRRSLMEISSIRPTFELGAGDRATMLGGDGYAGVFQCVLESYGMPVTVRVLGAIADPGATAPVNIADRTIETPVTRPGSHPIVIAVAGVRMDSGKSTAIRQIAHQLRKRGLTCAAGKVTGFGCRYETLALGDPSAIDFTDFGLPSTCGDRPAKVLEIADHILESLRAREPDVIILEFGGGIVDAYRAEAVLGHLKDRIDLLIFAAFDICGVLGGAQAANAIGKGIDIVTGPIANTSLGVEFVRQFAGLSAESNRAEMKLVDQAVARLLDRMDEAPAVP